jgi:NADH dehydrogenase
MRSTSIWRRASASASPPPRQLSPLPKTDSIAVTGAGGQVGTLLCEQLADRKAKVLALDRNADWGEPIRSAGVVVHLAGTLQPKRGDSYESANVRTSEVVAEAARDAGLRRIVFLSYVGAAADSANAYLRAKARAEEVLVDSGVPTTVFRCLHIYGPPERPGPTAEAFLVKGRRPVTVPGNGRQRIAPLYVGDVVGAVLAAATDPDAPTGCFELGGPDEMTMNQFVAVLNHGQGRMRNLPAPLARIAARLSPALTPALIDLLICDNVTAADPNRVGAEFGFTPRRFADVWGAASSRSADDD